MTTRERPRVQHEYKTIFCDSTRWDGYRPRAGDIVVASANEREAEDLDVDVGAAVMCAVRRFTDERGGLLEVSRSVHPAEHSHYETRVRRVIGA